MSKSLQPTSLDVRVLSVLSEEHEDTGGGLGFTQVTFPDGWRGEEGERERETKGQRGSE